MMTQQELTALNLGENLDQLMNLDPRGYGVCRILYKGCRDLCGEPVSLHAAKGLIEHIHEGDLVYILTGFVLLPHKKAEMDGIVSSVLLARALCATRKMLLLDEPVSGLDPKATAEMYRLIEELNRRDSITVVMISHDVAAAVNYASHILHIGDTVFFGTRTDYLQSRQGRLFASEKGGDGNV